MRSQWEKVLDGCHKQYNETIYKKAATCHDIDDPKFQNYLCDDGQEICLSKREKRIVPLIIYAGVIAVSMVGSFAIVSNELTKYSELANAQREVLIDAGQHLRALRDTIIPITKWGADIDRRVANLQFGEQMKGTVASFLNSIDTFEEEQSANLNQIMAAVSKNKASEVIRKMANVTLWEEPASEWSYLKGCSYKREEDSLALRLHFNMPRVNKLIKIMEAVPLNFYNVSTEQDKSAICWYKYNGPKHVLVNTTNGCKTEIAEFSLEGSVRGQYCSGKEDEMRDDITLWKRDVCQEKVHPRKDHIQDKELNGMHKIYCYPYNISIEGAHQPCPEYPFELPGRTTYRIANLEHYGAYVENEIVKEADLNVSKELVEKLKVANLRYTPPNFGNLTEMSETFDTVFASIMRLPGALETPQIGNLFVDPMGFFKSLVKPVMQYIETVGIALGVIGILFIVALIMPVLEILFALTKVVAFALRAWHASLMKLKHAIHARVHAPNNLKVVRIFKKKKNYWDIKRMA
ncbi:Hypothetical predicted protein [Olea europaea subsp. europaea]|uniref:Uncharacterized protein n=1 Tax=Olea europaea subsp. europaea TaxID=158383 RepID=A0A8S0Q3Z6_OLEEU|nr:Hypothetical predicted protein [Olea europaea subsp. europaea]